MVSGPRAGLQRLVARMGGILSRVADKLPSRPKLCRVEDPREWGSSYRTPVTSPSDLSIVIKKDEEPRLHILNRKVPDATILVTHSIEDGVQTKKTPLYDGSLEDTPGEYYPNLQSLEREAKLTEKKISEFRKVAKDKLKKDVDGPFTPLTNEEKNNVYQVLQGRDKPSRKHDVLVRHEESNIEITRENIRCLSDTAWLNDEVINLYFELLKEREKRDPKKFLKCHFFNTFFFKKLTSGSNGYDFKAVRRWTTQRRIGYGLIECDKIFVPIHKEIHWCLAVINVQDEKFQYLDSLGGRNNSILEILARYYVDEAKDKSNRVIDVKSWTHEHVNPLPRQKNGWDCGMFMIKYADFYSRGLDLSFDQEDMDYFRKRTAKELLMLRAD